MIEARVVLANGTALTTSKTSYPDLFWALNGAGFNFGVVTELKIRVYELGDHDTWSMEAFVFPGTRLEEVYATANELMRSQPPETVHLSMWTLNPEIDPVNPAITYLILYDGNASNLRKQAAPLDRLNPLSAQKVAVPYVSMPAAFSSSNQDFACAPGLTFQRYPIDFLTWNTTALRRVYELAAQTFAKTPAFNATWIALEGYPTHAVQAIEDSASAFPWRSDNLLLSPFIIYEPDPKLDAKAQAFGKAVQRILQAGTGRPMEELHTYVNYAHGDEGPESWYGFDSWRLEKLRGLKREWDPENKFRYFAPIERG